MTDQQTDERKQRIAAAFDAAPATYDAAAEVQRLAARFLASQLPALPHPPHIAEIGCGTGLLTRCVKARYPQAHWTVTDLSPIMVATACKNLPDLTGEFRVMDGEHPNLSLNRYDLLVSSFAAQWFTDLPSALPRLTACLSPGGVLALCLPAAGSLKEWHRACGFDPAALNYPPATTLAKALPNARITVREFRQTYPDGRAFLTALKAIGAGTPASGHAPLSTAALRAALKRLGQPATVSWQILTLLWTKET